MARSAVMVLGGSGRCRLLLVATLAMLSAIFSALSPAFAASLEANAYKMAGDATHTRIVMNFDREPEPRWFLLRGPHRLVIDLPETKFSIASKDLKARGLVKGVRYGHLEQGSSRLILTAQGTVYGRKARCPAKRDQPRAFGWSQILRPPPKREFDAALADPDLKPPVRRKSTPKGDRLGVSAGRAGKRFTVVIDPGHGGIDGGAEGKNGTVEKSITLTFATELRDRLAATGKYDVFMTREKDEFLRLDDRVRIARQHEADLFISVHADTINQKGIRGATVYTVSDKASDAEAQALADRENLSDQLAGIEIEEDDKQVADILIDLIRRETHSFSMRFARSLVGELSSTVGLINNPHRSAGFKVLKAPDVPSVLVELGYLSNPKDEEQLRSPDWRGKAATSISNAISLFAAAKIGAGG